MIEPSGIYLAVNIVIIVHLLEIWEYVRAILIYMHISIIYVCILLQGVQLIGELAGQSESDTIHTDDLYRSSLNLVSSCRGTQFDMFHPQKMVMLTRIMISRFPRMDQICSLDDNLVRFGGESECGAIKMWDNTFGHRSERYLVGLGTRKDPKRW